MAPRAHSDEAYVIDLCDRLLGMKALRQWRFPFLLGDPGKNGRCVRLPVDAFYPELGLVVEYHERQHGEPVPFFDRRITAAGISRGEQRRIYDERRRKALPEQGMRLAVICNSDLAHNGARRLLRDGERDERAIRAALEAAGVLFIDQNGNGPRVRLRGSEMILKESGPQGEGGKMRYISENDVIDAVIKNLRSKGLDPEHVYAGRQGIDISVSVGDEKWAIEAKGGTGAGTDSNAFTQVSTAILTAMKRLNEEKYAGYRIGIAIPDGGKFLIHINSASISIEKLGIVVFLVDCDRNVRLYRQLSTGP